jgi:activator of HSP90 ATPase
MANSPLINRLFEKTMDLNRKKDPITVLWRNVLIVGIEDLLKKKETQIKFDLRKSYSIEEMWFNHEDFDLICEYSELEPKIVKKRVYETIERMEKKYADKNNMPKVPWKWLYKSEEINRGPNRYSTTMYDV